MKLHPESVSVIATLLIMLALAWAVGTWLGNLASNPSARLPNPRWSIRTMMFATLGAGVGLALLGRDPDPIVFGLVMVPPITLFTYFFRPR